MKYFKCDWTPRKPDDYYLSNVLLLHIKEMIELENAVEIDGIKNVATKVWDGAKSAIRKVMPVAKPIVSTAAQAMQAAPDPRIQITGTGLEWANRYLSQL